MSQKGENVGRNREVLMKPIDDIIFVILFPHRLIYQVTYRILIQTLLLLQNYYGFRNQNLQNVSRCCWLLCLLFRYLLISELGKVIKLSMLNSTLNGRETVFTLISYVQVLFITNLFHCGSHIMRNINLDGMKSHPASHRSV